MDHGLKAGGQGGVSDTKIVHEFVVARAHEGVVGERSAFGIDHFVAVTFERSSDRFRVAVADTQLRDNAVVEILSVGSNVEVQQVSVAVFDRPCDARCTVVATGTGKKNGAAFLDWRKETFKPARRRGGNWCVFYTSPSPRES